MAEDDLEYYERRAREKLEAAAASGDRLELASAHRLLAMQYQDHLEELRAAPKRSTAKA